MNIAERKTVQTVVGVVHEVADFEKWHAVYLENSNPDGRIGVMRNVDNPNLLYIGERTESHAAARAFFDSDDLKNAMQSGGVISKPAISYRNLYQLDAYATAAKYRVSIAHTVADFEAWKVLFDSDEENRAAIGLSTSALGVDESNSNDVFVMFATDDIDAAKAMFTSERLKTLMGQAGVTSAPEINYWKLF
jgi:hypothetical protein